jgi:hypothetical protein
MISITDQLPLNIIEIHLNYEEGSLTDNQISKMVLRERQYLSDLSVERRLWIPGFRVLF